MGDALFDKVSSGSRVGLATQLLRAGGGARPSAPLADALWGRSRTQSSGCLTPSSLRGLASAGSVGCSVKYAATAASEALIQARQLSTGASGPGDTGGSGLSGGGLSPRKVSSLDSTGCTGETMSAVASNRKNALSVDWTSQSSDCSMPAAGARPPSRQRVQSIERRMSSEGVEGRLRQDLSQPEHSWRPLRRHNISVERSPSFDGGSRTPRARMHSLATGHNMVFMDSDGCDYAPSTHENSLPLSPRSRSPSQISLLSPRARSGSGLHIGQARAAWEADIMDARMSGFKHQRSDGVMEVVHDARYKASVLTPRGRSLSMQKMKPLSERDGVFAHFCMSQRTARRVVAALDESGARRPSVTIQLQRERALSGAGAALSPRNLTPRNLTPRELTSQKMTPRELPPRELRAEHLTPRGGTPRGGSKAPMLSASLAAAAASPSIPKVTTPRRRATSPRTYTPCRNNVPPVMRRTGGPTKPSRTIPRAATTTTLQTTPPRVKSETSSAAVVVADTGGVPAPGGFRLYDRPDPATRVESDKLPLMLSAGLEEM
eukprot:TRINITY_DN75630_c0_g1_i1.p1 TRINITY_DN75630_c0_g1~~TRINITY_DN75630_c0_g1_i1.p1  ORF type:complete len:564 (+),score=39.47 TRINITY_DN75630_c0_g1_i1:49-1692(+)